MKKRKSHLKMLSLLLILVLSLSTVACSTKARTAVTPDKDPSVVVVDKSFTDDLLKEKGVVGGQIYLQNGTVVGVILADKAANAKDIEAIATKYSKEMKSTYKTMKVNVQAVQDGKNVANITLD